MIDNFKNMGKLKYFVLVVLLCFGGYIWAESNGYRFLGDDVDSKELHEGKFQSAHSHRSHRSHHFYHK